MTSSHRYLNDYSINTPVIQMLRNIRKASGIKIIFWALYPNMDNLQR